MKMSLEGKSAHPVNAMKEDRNVPDVLCNTVDYRCAAVSFDLKCGTQLKQIALNMQTTIIALK